jgi:hypothetical protein
MVWYFPLSSSMHPSLMCIPTFTKKVAYNPCLLDCFGWTQHPCRTGTQIGGLPLWHVGGWWGHLPRWPTDVYTLT